jgi:hypothetical protein
VRDNSLTVAVLVVAFIAGYSIVGFLVKKIRSGRPSAPPHEPGNETDPLKDNTSHSQWNSSNKS